MLFSYIDPADFSQIGFYTSHDTRPGFLASLGLPLPAVVEEESAATDEFYLAISAEEADRFADVDVFVTYGDADGAIIEQLQADPLLSQIPAIANGRHRHPRELDAARRLGQPVAALDRLGHRRVLRAARERTGLIAGA